MRILFISHSFPPVVGGVESQNYNLSEGLKKIAVVKIIANGRGKKFLPFFLVWAFLKSFFLMTRYDACLLGNGVLAPLGSALKFFHPKKKFFCVVHGLDITYANRDDIMPAIYRNVNIPSMKKLDRLFMVGNATIEEAAKIGVDKKQCKFIPNGVNPSEFKEYHTRKELSELFGRNTDDKIVILRLGRFVPHKGTSWFIKNVMPKFSGNILLIAAGNRVGKNTAGDQDDFLECERAIVNNNLENQVRLMPSIPWEEVRTLYNTVDLVVSPNIKVPGTMEGFGINVIEAGACERVVVASDLEGLADAIKHKENGILIEPENIPLWVETINKLASAGKDFRKQFGKRAAHYIKDNFTWDRISKRYLEEMEK